MITLIADDPNITGKLGELTNLLEKQELWQETMKAVNAYFEENGTLVGAPGITDAHADMLETQIFSAFPGREPVPFQDHEIEENRGKIERLKIRFADIILGREVFYRGWVFDGGEAEVSEDFLALRFFDEPSERECLRLEAYGFMRSEPEDAWVRILSGDAIRAADALGFVSPSDGRSAEEHQPKARKPEIPRLSVRSLKEKTEQWK